MFSFSDCAKRFLCLLVFVASGLVACAQHKWKTNDTLFVMYPDGCFFYKQPDVNADKYFTFIRSTKVVLLDTRPYSAPMQINGVWGQLKLVQWQSYKGYVFDGYLTSMYVCKFEHCRDIIDGFDWSTVREFSLETPYDCPMARYAGIPDSLKLHQGCDSIEIQWRTGVLYESYRAPNRFTEVYTIPHVTVQEVFLRSKLLYKELLKASLKSSVLYIEDESEAAVSKHKYTYRFDKGRKLAFFGADYKEYDRRDNRLMADFSMEIRSVNKNFVQVTVEKNYHNQLIIKSN